MTLIVEDGTGVANANSYASPAQRDTFFNNRGLALPTDANMLQAMDILEMETYKGIKTIVAAHLSFPITGSKDKNGTAHGDNTIPPEIINAQLWLSHYIQQGHNVGAVGTPQVKSEKADIVETEYAVSEYATTKLTFNDMPNAYNSIKHLLSTESAMSSWQGVTIRA
jgi:hypothetical protein